MFINRQRIIWPQHDRNCSVIWEGLSQGALLHTLKIKWKYADSWRTSRGRWKQMLAYFPSSPPCVQLLQSCPTLCDPMDCSSPGFSFHGILEAIILEWDAMPSSRGSSQRRDWTHVTCIAGRFFTHLTTWEARFTPLPLVKDNVDFFHWVETAPGSSSHRQSLKTFLTVLASAAHILKLEWYRED